MTTIVIEEQPINPARRVWVESVSLLFRYKWLIILTTVIVTVGTGVYLFGYAKNWYKAEANIVPPRKSGGGLLDGLSSTIKDLGMTTLAGKNKGEGVYSPLALIASREVQEKLVKEFDFAKIYEANTLEDAIKEFGSHTAADVQEEGNIIISFEDTDPARAANVSNRLVQELNAVSSKLAIEEAKFNSVYVTQRYSKLMSDLDSADKALGEFQKKYGVYELKAQAAAQLGALGLLEQQRYTAEIQLNNAEQLYGSEAAETNVLRSQLRDLQAKLNDLKSGMDKDAKSYFVPMNVMPDVALEYLRLTREVEIQSKLKAFLLPSFEQAKLDETKQSLSYLVLDKALPPTRKSRPKRSMQLLVAMLGSFAVTSIAVIAMANFSKVRTRFRQDKASLGL